MKQALLFGIAAVLLLTALAGCAKEQAQELPTDDPQIETAAPETPSQEPQAETITTAAPEQTAPEQREQITTPEPVQQEPENVDPAPVELEQQNQAQNQAQAIFTEVNETVYATNNVNIRSSYTAASDKIGLLSYGQSVVRTGIGTGDAAGWSRVKLSDGTVAYISSQYLSTTKPVSSGNGNSNSQGSSGSNGSSGSGSSSGGSGSSGSNTSDPDLGDFPGFTDPSELGTGVTEEQMQWDKDHIKITY